MTGRQHPALIRLHPRANTPSVGQGRTVLATGCDGFIAGGPDHGLFMHQTCGCRAPAVESTANRRCRRRLREI
jgi:hypothetical protein